MFDNPKIQSVGFETEKIGDFEKEKIKAVVEKTFDWISKKTDIEALKLHIKIHNEAGERQKYSTHAHLVTKERVFNCNDFEWTASGSVSKAMDVLEEQVKKYMSKKTTMNNERMRTAKEDKLMNS